MDLRVIVLTNDFGLSELLRAQIENLGCSCSLVPTYDEAGPALDWADAAVVDLVGDGLDDLNRLRVEAPRLRVLAIAPSPDQGAQAGMAGADHVLVEPFSIADVVAAVRTLGPPSAHADVVDLRTGAAVAAPVVAEAPWWATH